MVQSTFDLPLVFVSLVDQNRQWFKSTVWETNACPRAPETGRDVSFCGHAIHLAENEELVIPNAADDERFADNPLVTGDLGLRFYAGIPLAVPAEDGNGTVNSTYQRKHMLASPLILLAIGAHTYLQMFVCVFFCFQNSRNPLYD